MKQFYDVQVVIFKNFRSNIYMQGLAILRWWKYWVGAIYDAGLMDKLPIIWGWGGPAESIGES